MEGKYESYWLPMETKLNNRYVVEGVIGEGGMGIVYLGYDSVLDCKVSVKEYFPRKLSTRDANSTDIHIYVGPGEETFNEGLEKFVDEARILAKFDNIDGIVSVRDFFYENNTAYIVMEHVDGETIRDIVDKCGKIEGNQTLELMKPILYSLIKIHQKGLLHRDISPDNIIIDKEKKAYLIDFGAARFLENEENKTMTVFFTRGYSAEEQYAENSHKGPYTDVYGICSTMYFMLTGIRPEESIRRLIHDHVVPLDKFKDVVLTKKVKRAIMKGMSVTASKRYETVELLCRDLYGNDDRVNTTIVKVSLGIGLISLLVFLGGYILKQHNNNSVNETLLNKAVSENKGKVVSKKEISENNNETVSKKETSENENDITNNRELVDIEKEFTDNSEGEDVIYKIVSGLRVEILGSDKKSEKKDTAVCAVMLYEGMKYSIPVRKLKQNGEVDKYVAIGDVGNIQVVSTNKKVASVNKEGIISAKKAGTTNIVTMYKNEIHRFKLRVKKFPSLKGKKFVRESKFDQNADCEWSMWFTYKKKDAIVKKGIVEANKKYDAKLVSIVTYKVKGKKQYVMKYQLLDKDGKELEGVFEEMPFEKWLYVENICIGINWSRKVISKLAKQKKFLVYWDSFAQQEDTEFESEDEYYDAMDKYGWKYICE